MEEESLVKKLLKISGHLAFASLDNYNVAQIDYTDDHLDDFGNFELPYIQEQFVFAELRVLRQIKQNLEKVITNKLNSNLDLNKIILDPNWGYNTPTEIGTADFKNRPNTSFKIRPNDLQEFKKQWLKHLIGRLSHIHDAVNKFIILDNGSSTVNTKERKKQQERVKIEKGPQLIFIDPTVLDNFYNLLKGFFPGKEHELYKALKGEVIEEKLHFPDMQNKLAEVFYRLQYNNFIISKNSQIIDWLCSTFTYLYQRGKVTEIRDLKHNTLKDMFNGNKGEPTNKTNCICKVDWLPFRKSSR